MIDSSDCDSDQHTVNHSVCKLCVECAHTYERTWSCTWCKTQCPWLDREFFWAQIKETTRSLAHSLARGCRLLLLTETNVCSIIDSQRQTYDVLHVCNKQSLSFTNICNTNLQRSRKWSHNICQPTANSSVLLQPDCVNHVGFHTALGQAVQESKRRGRSTRDACHAQQ